MNEYFKVNNISRYGNAEMYLKSAFMLSLYLVPLLLLNLGLVNYAWLLFVLYLVAGLGKAGIGMGIMHDALHGSYSKNKIINKLMGYTMNLIGADANVWKVKHNVLHHTYTNIDEHDEDIDAPLFLRFSPNSKHYKIHRFQHLYIWFFYGLSTISWTFVKDYMRWNRYRKEGYFKGTGSSFVDGVKISLWKLFYVMITLVIPMIMLPFSWWVVLLGFFAMHFITGLVISVVFQAAHVVQSTDFPLPNELGMIENEWAAHQLTTTSNFSPKSRVFYWLIGGLNYQVEHHLLPNVCHVHYKALSKIVRDTAAEFGLPYLTNKTFFSAIGDHARMLKRLGQFPVKKELQGA